MTELLLIAVALLLVLANGFFVASEFAIVKVRATQLAEGGRGGLREKVARRVVRELDAHLSSTQLGITLASLALGWIGEPAFARLIERVLPDETILSAAVRHGISFAIAFSILTALHIVVGELAPKSLAIRRALPTVLWTAVPLSLFTKAMWPIIWVLNSTANRVLALMGLPAGEAHGETHSEEEIRLLLEEQVGRGQLSRSRHRILEGFLDLTRRTARHIMIPRTDVVILSTTRSVEENLRLIRETGHSRYPVCEGDLDHTVGMIHVKDLIRRPAGSELEDFRQIKREILFVPESLPVERLLAEFRSRRIHMAIVVDEFGGGAGVATLSNVLEELVGQIDDEFDLDRPEFESLADGSYRVRGDFLLDDLAQRLRAEPEESEADTVGGYVLERLGREPRIGDRIEILGHPARIVEARQFRVDWIVVSPRAETTRDNDPAN